jgi:hypothetical protein
VRPVLGLYVWGEKKHFLPLTRFELNRPKLSLAHVPTEPSRLHARVQIFLIASRPLLLSSTKFIYVFFLPLFFFLFVGVFLSRFSYLYLYTYLYLSIYLLSIYLHASFFSALSVFPFFSVLSTVRSESRCALQLRYVDLVVLSKLPLELQQRINWSENIEPLSIQTQICRKCLRIKLNWFRPL